LFFGDGVFEDAEEDAAAVVMKILLKVVMGVVILGVGLVGSTAKAHESGAVVDAGDTGTEGAAKVFWKEQIRKVRLGMKQYVVYEILPSRSEGRMDFAKDGKSYTYTYALDEHWSVAMVYDRSGYHEANNPYSVMGFPNDKVIGLPRLVAMRNRIDARMFPYVRPKR
jgi:hypothetical protein